MSSSSVTTVDVLLSPGHVIIKMIVGTTQMNTRIVVCTHLIFTHNILQELMNIPWEFEKSYGKQCFPMYTFKF